MQKHGKIRNVPFPRPCGASGNDAKKLHAPVFAHFRGAVLMHVALCTFALILSACGHAAADMPLGLVDIKQLTHLMIQCRADRFQPLGEILVYGAFGNVKLLCGGPYRCLVFNDVFGKIAGALFNICVQMHHSPNSHSPYICEASAGYDEGKLYQCDCP